MIVGRANERVESRGRFAPARLVTAREEVCQPACEIWERGVADAQRGIAVEEISQRLAPDRRAGDRENGTTADDALIPEGSTCARQVRVDDDHLARTLLQLECRRETYDSCPDHHNICRVPGVHDAGRGRGHARHLQSTWR